MFEKDTYNVRIKLTEEMLGTNPLDPNVMDNHIIDRQRKLISDNSNINKAINKYLDAKDISIEDQAQELTALRNRIEHVAGKKLSDSEFEALRDGSYKDVKGLIETFKELKEKGVTVFYRDDSGHPVIGSHMIHGFLKAAGEVICRMTTRKNGVFLKSGTYTTSTINQRISITPKFLKASNDINKDEYGNILYNQRSLRAMTAQGPRISLAKSEVLPAGTEFEFKITVLNSTENRVNEDHLIDLLSYGEIKGLGQWRSSGKGSFKVVEIIKQ